MTNFGDTENEFALVRARALASAGRLAWFQADFVAARAQFTESLKLFQQVGDVPGTLESISGLILVLTRKGELAEALALIDQAQLLLQSVGERRSFLPILASLARSTAFMAAEEALSFARTWGQEAAQLARAAGDKRSLAWALDALATCDYYEGQLEAARAELEEGIPLFEEVGDQWGVSFEKWLLASVARREELWEEARTLNREALTGQSQQNSRQGLPYMIDNCAFLAIEEKQLPRAAQLLAASEALGERLSNVRQPLYEAERTAYIERALALGDAATEWDNWWKQGLKLTAEDAVALALEDQGD